MRTSFRWSLTVHSVSVSLITLLLDGLNVESLWVGAIEFAPVSGSLPKLEPLLLPLSIPFTPSSRIFPCTLTKPSICCDSRRLLLLGLSPHFCFFLGGWNPSSGSLYISVTSDVCASYWAVTSPVGRRAALRAAKALTAGSAIRARSFPRVKAKLYLPCCSVFTIHSHLPSIWENGTFFGDFWPLADARASPNLI